MKALTLTAPYGTLIEMAERWPELGKHHETRGPMWHYKPCGLLAIHQGKNLKPVDGALGLKSLCRTEPFLSALCAYDDYYGHHAADDPAFYLPLGAVVAVAVWTVTFGGQMMYARGVDTVPIPTGNDRAFGGYDTGRKILKLEQIRRLPEPVFTRGYQGLWNLPADVEANVRAQLRIAA